MVNDNKRIAKNTGLLYIRQLLTLALSLYTSRLTLQVLGETDFGVYATVAGFTALLSTLTTSFASGTQRFITFELGRGNIDGLNRVYCTAINIHIFLSLLLVIFGETFGIWFIFNKMSVPDDRLMTAFWVFQLTIAGTILTLINAPNNAEIIAHEDMGVWALVSILDAVFRCIGVLVLSYLHFDRLLIYAIIIFAVQFILRVICLEWCTRRYEEANFKFIWDKQLIKSMLSVTGWTGLNNLAVTGFIQGVNILLNVFFGPVMNAAYTIAMQAYSGIRQFCASFQLASNPQIVKLYSIGEIEKMQSLVISVCRLSFFMIFFLSFPFLLNAEFILKLWLKDVPAHTQSFFSLLIIFAYFDVFAYPMDIAAQATGKLKKYSLLVSITFISILFFSYLAFAYGATPESIYYIAIVITFICVIIRLVCLNKLIRLSIYSFIKDVLFKSITVALLALSLPFGLKYIFSDNLISIIISFIVSFLSSLVSIYFLGLNVSEKHLIKGIVQKIIKK